MFEERGFLDTRVADIVAAAGVAQGTFCSYFDSKEAAFTEVATYRKRRNPKGQAIKLVRVTS